MNCRVAYILFIFLTEANSWFSFQGLHEYRYNEKITFMRSSGAESDPDGMLDHLENSLGKRTDVSETAEAQSKEVMRGLKDLDRDPNMVANCRFMEWLDLNEVLVKSKSTWGRAQHPLVNEQFATLNLSYKLFKVIIIFS